MFGEWLVDKVENVGSFAARAANGLLNHLEGNEIIVSNIPPVPEPSSLALMGFTLGIYGLFRVLKKRIIHP